MNPQREQISSDQAATREKRLAEYERQKQVEATTQAIKAQERRNRPEDIKNAEASYQQSRQELLAAAGSAFNAKWELQEQNEKLNKDYKFLSKAQPFYNNYRIKAAAYNTLAAENRQLAANYRAGKEAPHQGVDNNHNLRLIRQIQEMETPNDPAVVLDEYLACGNGDGYGDVIDLAGNMASGIAGKALNVLGYAEELTSRFHCYLRAGVTNVLIGYYYKKGQNQLYQTERKSINDNLMVKGIDLSCLP